MIALPEGYELGHSKREIRDSARAMLADDWRVDVYHKGRPAFTLAKQLLIDKYAPVYAGRLINGDWQQFTNIQDAIAIMCTKHRIGVGK